MCDVDTQDKKNTPIEPEDESSVSGRTLKCTQ